MTLPPKAAVVLEQLRAAGWAGIPWEQVGRGVGKINRLTLDALERRGLAVYMHELACFGVSRTPAPVSVPSYGPHLTVPGSFRWVAREVLDAAIGAETVAAAFKEGGRP